MMVKSVVALVMSARRPKEKHSVLMEIPRMVRNCRCQPNDSFWWDVRNVTFVHRFQTVELTN